MKALVFSFLILSICTSALAELIPGENDITYLSDNVNLAGHLYLPDDFDPDLTYPLVVFARPATGIKEQTAGLYAEKLSSEGFVTIAFDPKGFGESEGRPQDEYPVSIISDIRNTISYAESLPFVDKDNIFAAGVCMGSGYATYATALDDRIKAVATISPYLTLHIDQAEAIGDTALRKMADKFTSLQYISDFFGKYLFMPAVPENELMASLPFQTPVSIGMMDYYLPDQPGSHPNWINKMNTYHFEELVFNYNPFDVLPLYNDKPFYMAYGTGGYSTELLQEFYDSINTVDKQLRIVDGTHFEIYWQDQHVDPIVEDISNFFTSYMN